MGRRLSRKPGRSLTLVELLIAIVLFSTISLGFFAIDTFSRRQVISSERQAQLQNEASIALEHIAKEARRAIGSTVLSGQTPVDLTNISGDTALRIYVDLASDGVSAGDGKWGTEGDRWRAYRWTGSSGAAADRYQLWYYPNYVNPGDTHEVIARHISAWTPTAQDNWINVSITACWDPSGTCGTTSNPQVNMSAKVMMPGVSLN